MTTRDWYTKEFGEPPATFTDITVDGYDAVADRDSYYINALNVGENGETYNNIYNFNINHDAQANTRQVFSALLDSLRFNINVTDFGVCSNGDGSDPNHINIPSDAVSSIACTTDFDCTAPIICANAKTKLQRDWTRLHDIGDAQAAIEAYQDRPQATYPTLTAGTFIPGYTTSLWPSWNRFGSLLGAGLPHDPIDRWTDPTADPDIDKQTFWNARESQFLCPARAQIYEYKMTGVNGSDYDFLRH